MKCRACGIDLAADAVFCPKCGVRVASDGETNFPTSSAQHRHDLANEPEHELWQGSFSGRAMYGSWLLALLLTAGLVVVSVVGAPVTLPLLGLVPVIWLGLIMRLWYRKLNLHYTLTNQRFIIQSGILVRTTDRFEVIEIDDVMAIQGLLERLLGIGTIKIVSNADKERREILLEGIADVQTVAALIDDTRRKDRRRRGVYMEQM